MLRCLVVYLPLSACKISSPQILYFTNTTQSLHKYCRNTAQILHWQRWKICSPQIPQHLSPASQSAKFWQNCISTSAKEVAWHYSDTFRCIEVLAVSASGRPSIYSHIRSCIIHTPWTSSKHMQNKPWSFSPTIWPKCPLTWPYFCW